MGMIKSKVVTLSFIICMLLTGCGNEQMNLKDAQAVSIMCEKQSGSGVIYEATDEHVVIVTAAHVVEGAETAKVIWGTDAEEAASISDMVIVSGLDLAFLRMENAATQWSVRQGVKEMERTDAGEVSLRGRGSSGELQDASGNISGEWVYVEDFGCHMTIVKAEASPGMSGGGVFDSAGEFLGIICGMDEDNNVAILPASVISSEYDVIVWE